jgi:hypothetical protein
MKKLLISLILALAFALPVQAAPVIQDAVIDVALDELATATNIYYTSQIATTYTEAAITFALANVTVTAGDGGGDWTIANGDTSGRKLTLGAQTGITLTANGTVAFACATVSTTLLGCVDISGSPVIATTETWDTAAVDFWEIRDAQ